MTTSLGSVSMHIPRSRWYCDSDAAGRASNGSFGPICRVASDNGPETGLPEKWIPALPLFGRRNVFSHQRLTNKPTSMFSAMVVDEINDSTGHLRHSNNGSFGD